MKSRALKSFARSAMLGLLAASQTACSENATEKADATGGASGGASEGSGGNDSGPLGGQSSGGAETEASGGTPAEAGEGGVGGSNVVIEGVTSSKVIADLSLLEFTEMCSDAGGVVETHATCGGVVTGKGFSYDSDTDVFTEHTCRGYNTCSGFSCVLDD